MQFNGLGYLSVRLNSRETPRPKMADSESSVVKTTASMGWAGWLAFLKQAIGFSTEVIRFKRFAKYDIYFGEQVGGKRLGFGRNHD
jgi:hypothetical protein